MAWRARGVYRSMPGSAWLVEGETEFVPKLRRLPVSDSRRHAPDRHRRPQRDVTGQHRLGYGDGTPYRQMLMSLAAGRRPAATASKRRAATSPPRASQSW